MARRLILLTAFSLPATWPASVPPGFAAGDDLGDAVRAALRRVGPSTVRIHTVGTRDRAGRISSRVTTGVVVTDHGEVITSSFGFGEGVAAIFVESEGGIRHSAEIVAQDHIRRLVLLEAEGMKLAAPEWAQEDPPVGAWAIAAGRFYPGSSPSAALGVISARNRIYGLALQTDAKVSPVNYGGPLITPDGRVVGILVPLGPGSSTNGLSAGVEWYDSGIGFAVPARDVVSAVEWLRNGKDRKPGLLGIGLTSRNPLATEIEVAAVHTGSPADTAGIREGDRITAIDGRSIERVSLLQQVLKSAAAGDRLQLLFRRGEVELEVTVELADELPIVRRGWLGMVPTGSATPEDDSVGGVPVVVLQDSPLAAESLPSACIVTAVGDTDVGNVSQLRQAVSGVTAGSTWILTVHDPEVMPHSTRSVIVTAADWPQDIVSLEAQVREIYASKAPEQPLPEWSQSVADLNDDTHAWLYGPAERVNSAELGALIVLNDGEPVTEHYMRGWSETCRKQRLVLMVVYRDYAIPLADPGIMGQIMKHVSRYGAVDQDRMALVTTSSHTGFVTRLLMNPRLRPIRQAVFLDCRPAVAGLALDVIAQKRLSLLLIESSGGMESRALTESSVSSLSWSGANVTLRHSETALLQELPSDTITGWLLLQKIR